MNMAIYDLDRYQWEALIDRWIFNERDRAIIKRRLLDGICFEQLAEECGYSEFYLMKLFKKFVGQPCIDYSIGYKLTQIALSLVNTDQNFCDLATCVGFANISYCNRQFKKMFALTPKEFRKTHKG